VFVKLFPEISNVTRDNPPIASFIMRVVSSAHGNRKALTHPGNQNSDFCNFCYFKFFVDRKLLDLIHKHRQFKDFLHNQL